MELGPGRGGCCWGGPRVSVQPLPHSPALAAWLSLPQQMQACDTEPKQSLLLWLLLRVLGHAALGCSEVCDIPASQSGFRRPAHQRKSFSRSSVSVDKEKQQWTGA